MLDVHQLPGLLPDEKLIKIYRRHPLTLFGLYAGIFITFIVPVSIYFFARGFNIDIFGSKAGLTIFVLFISAFLLFALLFVFIEFLDYWLDIWILTNRRIINIEHTGLFTRVRSEVRLYRVQDVTSELHGFLRHVFNYGMVYTQTAAGTHRFKFEDVPEPKEAAKLILQLCERDQRAHEQEITREEDPERFKQPLV